MKYWLIIIMILLLIVSCSEPSTRDNHNEPGNSFILIPAGEFTWGSNDEIQTIDYTYEIMEYEVTIIQYLEYIEESYAAGSVWVENEGIYGYYQGDEYYQADNYLYYELGLTPTSNFGRISYNGNSFEILIPAGYNAGDFDNHPLGDVSWFGANAYAEYYGWRLPTEQEWEKAARGMTGYNYSYGDTLSNKRSNYHYSLDPWDNGTTPIGFFNGQNYNGFQTIDSPSPFGCYDMCGNCHEWTESWFDSISLRHRVIRGGSYNSSNSSIALCSWDRSTYVVQPSTTLHQFGFRCAKTLD